MKYHIRALIAILLSIFLLIFFGVILVSCAAPTPYPERVGGIQSPSSSTVDGEILGGKVWRSVDRELGIVCYTSNGSNSLDCLPIPEGK